MRNTGGTVTGLGSEKRVISGTAFAVMNGNKKLAHNGNVVIADPSFDGTSGTLEFTVLSVTETALGN